jgi:hypothetical protein
MSTEITPNTNTTNILEYNRFDIELDRDKLDFLLALNDIECNFDEAFSTLTFTGACSS